MSPYNPDKCLRIPADCRLWISMLWGAAVGLLIADTIDGDASLLCVWAFFFALSGLALTITALHAYSRRVVLEVMSFEHRQMAGGDRPSVLSAID